MLISLDDPARSSHEASRLADDHDQAGPTGRLVELVRREMGLEGPAALDAAVSLEAAIRRQQIRSLAAGVIADIGAAKDQRLGDAHVVTAAQLIREADRPAKPLLGELVAEGHNATVTAQFKAGKTDLVLNMAAALTEGGSFLGRFPTGKPRRVALLNYELSVDDQRTRLRDLGLSTDALARLLVVNLRGSRLCITSPVGRDWLVQQLSDHGTDVLIGDTFGAASAPSVESENDNAAVRRFLATVDEILAVARCGSSIWTAHTGRKDHIEGAEHARGATVLDDWADDRIILTKDRNSAVRFLASEGRSPYALPESPLAYDQRTRALWLPDGDVGISRSDARTAKAADTVTAIVTDHPAITTGDLRDALDDEGITNNAAKQAAITKARTRGLVHIHKEGRRVLHYAGPPHPENTTCKA